MRAMRVASYVPLVTLILNDSRPPGTSHHRSCETCSKTVAQHTFTGVHNSRLSLAFDAFANRHP